MLDVTIVVKLSNIFYGIFLESSFRSRSVKPGSYNKFLDKSHFMGSPSNVQMADITIYTDWCYPSRANSAIDERSTLLSAFSASYRAGSKAFKSL